MRHAKVFHGSWLDQRFILPWIMVREKVHLWGWTSSWESLRPSARISNTEVMVTGHGQREWCIPPLSAPEDQTRSKEFVSHSELGFPCISYRRWRRGLTTQQNRCVLDLDVGWVDLVSLTKSCGDQLQHPPLDLHGLIEKSKVKTKLNINSLIDQCIEHATW
jgi:hypothetical protein